MAALPPDSLTGLVYTPAQIQARLASELPGWRFERGGIERRFDTTDWKTTLMAANAIAHLAESAWHHPDLRVTFSAVTVWLMTHDADGVTDKDFVLARKIDEVLAWRPAGGHP